MKIHAKLLTSLLLTALFPLLIVAVILYFSTTSTLIRVTQDNLDFSAATLAQGVLDTLESKYSEVESWCRLDTLQAVFTGDDVDLRLGLLLRDLRSTSEFTKIWCVDTRGQIIASSDFSEVGQVRLDHPAIEAALGNVAYISPVQERNPGAPEPSWIVHMSHPIIGAFDDETIIGALVATYDWENILNLVRIQTIARDREGQLVTLLDESSRVIAAADPNRMTRIEADGHSMKEASGRMITGIARVDNAKLGIHYTAEASVRKSTALASLRQLELEVAVVCLLATIGVILMSIRLTRSIGTPIVRLSETARRIAQGDLNVQPDFHSTDEIGTLARDLDAMRSNLKGQIDKLDSTVQARTRELEETIKRLRQEINDRIAAENQTKVQQQQLVQADKMVTLGILVSGVAHEINNPNALMGLNIPVIQEAWEKAMPVLDEYCDEHGDISLGAMRYSEMREHIPRLLVEMREGSDRIRAIVSDLRTFSRKHEEVEFEPIDLNKVVESAVGLVRKHIDKSTADFTVQLASALPSVYGDYQRIEQVVINLVLNACDALSDRSQRVRVETVLDAGGLEAEIRVTDEGCGIDPKNLPHITDPFFTTKRTSGGTGLGLSISSGIVEEHGGALQFDSAPGRGTTVILSLPIARRTASAR